MKHQISTLINQWEKSLLTGSELTAEELTADSPELLVELSERIASIKATDSFFINLFSEIDTNKGSTRCPKEYPLPKIIDNKYRLKKKIGAGHFGLVWLAEDIALEKDVAIKFPTYHILSDIDKVTQFKNEAKLLAELSNASQHIVEVKGLGIISPQNCIIDEIPYFVMELMTTTLDKHDYNWREKPLEVASVVAKLADALHGIHIYKSGNLIHRDIKPNNIFIKTYADDSFQVKLGDFGLALDPNTDPNNVNNHYGSIGYVAPEILTNQPASVRSDLYSLAVVFYVMLTGVEPFPSGSGQTRLVDNLVQGKMLPPATVNVHLNDFLPLQDVCLKAMSGEPDDRYDNAKQFSDALRSAIDLVTAKNNSIKEHPLTKPINKNKSKSHFLIAILIISFLAIVNTDLWLQTNVSDFEANDSVLKRNNDILKEQKQLYSSNVNTINNSNDQIAGIRNAELILNWIPTNPHLRTPKDLEVVEEAKKLVDLVLKENPKNKHAKIIKLKCESILSFTNSPVTFPVQSQKKSASKETLPRTIVKNQDNAELKSMIVEIKQKLDANAKGHVIYQSKNSTIPEPLSIPKPDDRPQLPEKGIEESVSNKEALSFVGQAFLGNKVPNSSLKMLLGYLKTPSPFTHRAGLQGIYKSLQHSTPPANDVALALPLIMNAYKKSNNSQNKTLAKQCLGLIKKKYKLTKQQEQCVAQLLDGK